MRRVFWLIAAALLLAGCAGEKGIVEKEGYQLDTRRQAQAAYPRIKVLVSTTPLMILIARWRH